MRLPSVIAKKECSRLLDYEYVQGTNGSGWIEEQQDVTGTHEF